MPWIRLRSTAILLVKGSSRHYLSVKGVFLAAQLLQQLLCHHELLMLLGVRRSLILVVDWPIGEFIDWE